MHPTTSASRRAVLSLAAHVGLLCTALLIAFGPLTPPGGAVSSTAKPLSEVEPRIAISAANTPGDADSVFKIAASGSYYLTGAVFGAAGKHGIEIAASDVTLDLGGFDLVGVSGSLDGVSVTLGSARNIAVLNGAVRNWGGDGVDLSTSSAFNCRVERVTASSNGATGITAGLNATVTACAAALNGSTGIVTLTSGAITGCAAYQNAGNGINANPCGAISGCTAYDNTGSGISLDAGTVTGCAAYSNGSIGIQAINGCTITGCSAYINATHGISSLTGGAIIQCIARANTSDGIRCSASCLVLNNNCSGNGNGAGDGANIHATGSDNRIEGNNCSGADRGIEVSAAGSIIVRNTCSGAGTNWDIVANNVCGPILDRTAPASALINGNTAPDSTGSTHPNANFTY